MLSCEMKNFVGPIWFFKRHVSRSDGVSKRISSVSVRSALNLNHSKLTYSAFASLTNKVVKGKKKKPQYFCILFTCSSSTKNIHAVLSHKVV